MDAAGAGFTLEGQQGQRSISAHSTSVEAQFVGCAEGYMGAPAVAPKTGKSSSSPGLVLFIVFTKKRGQNIRTTNVTGISPQHSVTLMVMFLTFSFQT